LTEPVTIIAEAGVNHNGDLDKAMALVDAAAEAGADAVKFQTFEADALARASAPKAAYQAARLGAALSQHEMLKALELPRDWHRPLMERAAARGIAFISTAFEEGSLAFLQSLDLPFYKVPSGELTNGPLLWRFARPGKPLVVSTGMATLGEIEQALAVIAHALTQAEEPARLAETWAAWATEEGRAAVAERVTLLHCTSQYPAPMDEVNLRAMRTLAEAFQLPVGYSDHTEGPHVAVAAVALGARVIEKHVTLDRGLPGPDHAASIEPGELAALVRAIREVSTSLGSAAKAPQRSEWDTRKAARQRLVAARPIAAGRVLTRADLTTARAAGGRPAMDLWDLVGSTAPRAYAPGEVIEA
jgi:N-acetylneuraminate synthase